MQQEHVTLQLNRNVRMQWEDICFSSPLRPVVTRPWQNSDNNGIAASASRTWQREVTAETYTRKLLDS